MQGWLADLLVAVLIFSGLRLGGFREIQALGTVGIYLPLPSVGLSPYFFFHDDVFRYLILSFSLLAFAANRLLLGTSLLAVAAIFKVHPVLAGALVLAWRVRRGGMMRALPSLVSSTGILALGPVLPFWLPGYSRAMIGFNLSTLTTHA